MKLNKSFKCYGYVHPMSAEILPNNDFPWLRQKEEERED